MAPAHAGFTDGTEPPSSSIWSAMISESTVDGAGLTVKASTVLTDADSGSATEKVPGNVPSSAGVPEMTPVEGLSVRPGGSGIRPPLEYGSVMSDDRPVRYDEIGHLTFRATGSPLPGLCHCTLNEAHAADPAAPIDWHAAGWREPPPL